MSKYGWGGFQFVSKCFDRVSFDACFFHHFYPILDQRPGQARFGEKEQIEAATASAKSAGEPDPRSCQWNPERMVNWQPVTEPFGTRNGRSRYLKQVVFLLHFLRVFLFCILSWRNDWISSVCLKMWMFEDPSFTTALSDKSLFKSQVGLKGLVACDWMWLGFPEIIKWDPFLQMYGNFEGFPLYCLGWCHMKDHCFWLFDDCRKKHLAELFGQIFWLTTKGVGYLLKP